MADANETTRNTLPDIPDLPSDRRIYFNGFSATITAPDVVIILHQSGRPTAVLNCSHIVAKTLQIALGSIVSDFEDGLGQNVMTIDAINETLAKQQTAK